MHSEDFCMAPTKCRNCGGPHRSDSRKCLARATRNGAPTKEQLKIIRLAGDREFQAVLRAKAAEERASVLEGNSDEEPSQPEVVDMENIQASSVEDTAGDAMRL
ncbi:putative eka-like protein [Erysiphe necator]|uniref:Putative eka-like protein n=1 Tax=Uncinula necator TaxID=52586 RepID=A0A0B1P1Y3_UNCNE|nr:putative eka-like protein [Erysiphe necator]